MIITIASGKGGTGKTTVSTSLALSLEQKVCLVDCDVEEPNAHIFFNIQESGKEIVNTFVPFVEKEKCNLCGACEDLCQFNAIAKIGKSVMVFPEMCHSCKGCMMVCEQDAIKEADRELGVIEHAQIDNIELVFGKLRVGEPMSPPLIKRVKKKIKSAGINIIDAPPGTSCPAISAMRDSDFVVLVTEPTPFGLNDLILAVEVVRLLKIPFGIVINRCDAGDNRTKQYAEKQGIPILLELADKRKIAEAYSRGEPVVHAMPEMKKEFNDLYHRIVNSKLKNVN
jgi:MinD superfamily P-loop ATPase